MSLFRALRHRNFSLFIAGQAISLTGTWMQRIAMSWLVYRLTGSVFLLGLVGFVGQLPTLLLAPFAGVVADRLNRHRIIVITQALAMLQALALAVLVLSGTIEVWHIMVLSVFLGIVNAQDMPARQSFLLEMVGNKDDLGNAIALNSSVVNAGRLLGPSIGGLIIAAAGEGMCFLFNAVSYGAVITALLLMRLPARQANPRAKRVLHELAEGFRYAFGFAPIKSILLLLGLVSLVGMPYTVLMPVFARDILRGGPHTLGFLMGSAGVGALGGALYLASRKSAIGLGSWVARASAIFGAGLIVFSFSRRLPLSYAAVCVAGFGMMVQMASSNTLLQTITDDNKRGRVMSFYTMAIMGIAPFGSLLAGSLAQWIGAPHTLLFGGISCCAGALLFARRLPEFHKALRPIYSGLGIIPETVPGIQAATDIAGQTEE